MPRTQTEEKKRAVRLHGARLIEVDPAPFEQKLREAGFYAEWKGKFGDEAWAILERSVGRALA